MAKKKKQKRKKTGEYAVLVIRGRNRTRELIAEDISPKEARALVFSHKPSAKNGKAMILAPGYKKHLKKKKSEGEL